MSRGSARDGGAFLLGVLVFVNSVNWADRQVVPILLPSIQKELALSDTEVGLVGGLAFALVYAGAAFVFGYLADRWSRRNVVLGGLVGWSLATAAGGMADGFWGLFAARFATGIGEASLYPCAMSLIADGFPAERRGRAIGVLGASAALGGGLGIGLGGWLVQQMGWRNVFFTYGGCGLLAVPLLLMLREPPRAAGHADREHDPPLLIVREALGDVRLLAVWAAGLLMMTCASGWVTWAPTYFVRELGFATENAGAMFGFAQLFGGVAGSLFGGFLGDRFRRRGAGGQLGVATIMGALTAPLMALALFDVPHALLGLAAVFGPFAVLAATPSFQSVVAEIVPARRLGLTFAVHMFFLAGAGSALGPLLIGAVSDATGSLRAGLLVPVAAVLASAVVSFLAEGVVRRRTAALRA